MAWLSLRDRVRSTKYNRPSFASKRSQLRWFTHLIRMPPGRHLLWKFLWACSTGRRSPDRSRISRWDYITHMAVNESGFPGGAGKLCWGEMSGCLGWMEGLKFNRRLVLVLVTFDQRCCYKVPLFTMLQPAVSYVTKIFLIKLI